MSVHCAVATATAAAAAVAAADADFPEHPSESAHLPPTAAGGSASSAGPPAHRHCLPLVTLFSQFQSLLGLPWPPLPPQVHPTTPTQPLTYPSLPTPVPVHTHFSVCTLTACAPSLHVHPHRMCTLTACAPRTNSSWHLGFCPRAPRVYQCRAGWDGLPAQRRQRRPSGAGGRQPQQPQPQQPQQLGWRAEGHESRQGQRRDGARERGCPERAPHPLGHARCAGPPLLVLPRALLPHV